MLGGNSLTEYKSAHSALSPRQADVGIHSKWRRQIYSTSQAAPARSGRCALYLGAANDTKFQAVSLIEVALGHSQQLKLISACSLPR